MEKKNKIILLILLIIIIIPVAYFGILALEEQIFYNGIKEISDIENTSDVKGDSVRNKYTVTNEEMKEFDIDAINATSTEILMLEDLKNKVFSPQYVEFINIQINRLNSENRTYTAMLENSEIYDQYKNGQIGYSRTLSLIDDKKKVIESYANNTGEYKVEADSFLSVHQDMKDKLYELGIDEDFLYNQIEDVKIDYVS